MALTIGIKRLLINNTSYGIKTGSAEYMPSTSQKTPIVDIAGNVIGATEEKMAGTLSIEAVLLNALDHKILRDMDGGELVLELTNGFTVTGRNLVQIGANSVTVTDGIAKYEFTGDIKDK